MSSEKIAVCVRNVSKNFEIYASPRDQLKQFVLPRLRKALSLLPRQYFREFSALSDVSFQIRRGEAYGLVGLNGCGKSTLLQIICGTLSPSAGSVTVDGRVAALLELGSGFNPDFSGRENVYLNGALLGLSKEQIDEKLESIQAFADIGAHFEQALVTYSSGMQMRLAFAVATAFDPDILIIDEALAVGDAFFQQKCFHRIEQFKQSGGTLLFVSHDANTVKQLCDRAILLSHGKVICDDIPRTVIDLYQGKLAQMSDLSSNNVTISSYADSTPSPAAGEAKGGWTKATSVITNSEAELVDFVLLNELGERIFHIESESQLTVRYRVRILKNFERPAFGLIIRDKFGRSVFETSTYAQRLPECPVRANQTVNVEFKFNFNLIAGQYSFSVGVANKGFARSEFEELSLLMHDVEQVIVLDGTGVEYYGGVFNMKPIITTHVLEPR